MKYESYETTEFYPMNAFNKASFKAKYHMQGKPKIETWSLHFCISKGKFTWNWIQN
jgi:hypothetical protein